MSTEKRASGRTSAKTTASDASSPALDGLSGKALQALCLLAFWNPRQGVEWLRRDMASSSYEYEKREVVEKVCRELAERGWAVIGAPDKRGRLNWVRLAARATPEQALAIIAAADAAGLLALREVDPVGAYYPFITFGRSLQMFRSFLQGRLKPGAGLAMAEAWDVATRYVSLLDPEKPAPSPLPGLPPPGRVPAMVLRCLSSMWFHRGLDVGPLLDAWRDNLAIPEYLAHSPEGDLAEYASLCVLSGRAGRLDVLPPPRSATSPPRRKPEASVPEGCRALLAGEPALAHHHFGAVDGLTPAMTEPDYHDEALSLPATHLLALLAASFHNPTGTRTLRLARPLGGASLKIYATEYARGGINAIRRASDWTFDALVVPRATHPKHLARAPVGEAGRIAQLLLAALPRQTVAALAPDALRAAEAAAGAYPTLAAAWLSAFAHAFPADLASRADDLADRLSAAGAHWFRPYGAEDDTWRPVIDALEHALPSTSSTAAAAPKRRRRECILVWRLSFGGDAYGSHPPKPGARAWCNHISTALRGADAPEDGTGDRELSWRELESGKFDDCLTDADRSVRDSLRRCVKPYSFVHDYPVPDNAVLAALCGAPNLCFPTGETRYPPRGYRPLTVTEPLTLERRDLPLAATSLPNGGMALRAEPWSLSVKEDAAIRCDSIRAYSCIPFSRQARATLAVFAAHGDERTGILQLPKAAIPALRPLLPRLAAVTPLQGELAAVGDGTDLPRIPADPTPLVRLVYRPDATSLVLTLHVRPQPSAPALLLVPGAGQPERLVAHKGRSAVLVRDLAAEKKGADAVRAALARRLEALSAAARPGTGKDKDAISLPPAALPMLDAAFDPDADRAAGLALPKPVADRAAAVREAFAATPEVPARLTATLRPYQLDGYVWLSRLAAAGFGACLADDMGLGKTLQAIALLLARAADGPSLVVCPASVCGNWRGELARFAPTLRPVMAWDADPAATDAALASAGPGDIVIAGYSLLAARADAFAARLWNGVVLDEAQAIKNEDTKRARAARRLSARFRAVCTGTPVENRLADVWSLFEFLNPGLLGTPADFARRFAADGHPAPSLKRLLSPLILRRTKRDVLDDLPDKTGITLPVLLSDDERAGYETVRRNALDTLEATGGRTNRISILAELTRLRRYCCHPSLVLGPDSTVPSAKLEALLDLLANLRENRHRALIFSQFTDYLAIVRRALDAAGHSHLYLDGQTPAADRARLVDAFQRGEGDFFLISLKAGGLGLNLTAANYVILLDPWWNPAVEQQAADRAHRIGQKHPVTVYRLIAADTVEERVLSLHAEKAALSRDLLDTATTAPSLTPDLLLSLFR